MIWLLMIAEYAERIRQAQPEELLRQELKFCTVMSARTRLFMRTRIGAVIPRFRAG